MADKNIKIIIEYDGSNFSGWQSQVEQKTIQDEITEAIEKVTSIKVDLIGAGRTDSGVHALGQVANFKIEHKLEPERFKDAINYYLPEGIRVLNSVEADFEFHARFDAIYRRYRYLIGSQKSAIYNKFRWELEYELDFDLLQKAAKIIVGEHDFSPFCVVSSLKEDNRCKIEFSRWFKYGPLLFYEIRGNRFLHSMVRSLVGGMVNLALVNQDKNKLNLTLGKFKNILNIQNNDRITFTAPPQGLYLVKVGY